tara:strand:+ start:203 stop:610 length:408 start_codon:yes stop_codon:yes gene_type:complete
MIDTNKYEGHTEGPWLELEVDKVVAYQFDENDNAKMVCNVFRDGDGGSAYEGEWGDDEVEANQKLIADAPLLLEEVKRYRQVFDRAIECALNDNAEQAMQFLLNMDYCLDDEEKVTDKNRHKYTWVNGEWRDKND